MAQSPQYLRNLRRKYGLGEFSKKKRLRISQGVRVGPTGMFFSSKAVTKKKFKKLKRTARRNRPPGGQMGYGL